MNKLGNTWFVQNIAVPLAIFHFGMVCAALLLVNGASAHQGPWLVFDVTSGDVVSQHEANRVWHPASLTKLMTTYTVIQQIKAGRISLKSPVKISKRALREPPSKMGFPEGTILTVENALKIIMVKSANDVSTALAESVHGSVENFVKAMNMHAQELGMVNSHFTNAHGLPDIDQFTTARDLGILALHLSLHYPELQYLFNIHKLRVGKSTLRNHNKMLFTYPGANGMKTGYICAAGLNVVTRAQRKGQTFIAVVLGAYTGTERNVLATQLLDRAFADKMNWEPRPLINQLGTSPTTYQIPGNLTADICRANWRQKHQTKKQRRAARAARLKGLKQLKDQYLKPVKNLQSNIRRADLGGATGPNPFQFHLSVTGGMPTPAIETPQWRPDKTLPPGES